MDITATGLVGPLQAALSRNLSGIAPNGWEIHLNPGGGYDLWLLSPDEESGAKIIENFLAIAALAANTMPLTRIGIKGHSAFSVAMSKLRAVFPGSTHCLGGALDLSLEAQTSGEYKLLRESVLQELDGGGSLFLLSREGIYCDVDLSAGADPPQCSHKMIGQSVGQMIGEEAHDHVTAALRRSLRDGVGGVIAYSGVVKGETRHYTAKIRPLQSMERALIIVNRCRLSMIVCSLLYGSAVGINLA